jgi:regulator of nucleoside diphosphate kinase
MTPFSQLPPITLTVDDRERLARLAYASTAHSPQAANYLAREVERARVLEAHQDARNFVRMGAWLQFRDDSTGRVRNVQLVYPHQADFLASKISVLTPVGAALIGLAQDQSIRWQTPAGEWRSLTVLSIGNSAEPDTVATSKIPRPLRQQ